MGMSVLMVTHDPDHALFCSDRVIMMEDGCIIGDGAPSDIITTENLRRIYGTESYVTDVSVESGETVRVCVPVIRTTGHRVQRARDASGLSDGKVDFSADQRARVPFFSKKAAKRRK